MLDICIKCNERCSPNDQIMKAYNQSYHQSCFICEDCQIDVANHYYFMEDQQKQKKVVLCEIDYLKRSNSIICLKCNKPITQQQQQKQYNYHPECIQCPSCHVSSPYQYEYKGTHYCRFHYSLLGETQCAGCNQAVLQQFVERKEHPNQIWHPECYMIYKFWSIKLNNHNHHEIYQEQELIYTQKKVFNKVKRVWTDLSSFEESSANCISDMLLHVAAGAFTEGIKMANQFIMHLHVLYTALSKIQFNLYLHQQSIQCREQAHFICKEMSYFFKLLTQKSDNITQQLLSIVTSLAKNLKYLIRISLASSQLLEHYGVENAIFQFLNELSKLEKKRVWISGRYWFKEPTLSKDQHNTCQACQTTIENDDCYQSDLFQWHLGCFQCTTCIAPLHVTQARIVSSHLYCATCQPHTEPSSIVFFYAYQHHLQQLKHELAQLEPDTDVQKKRQRSLLRILTVTKEEDEERTLKRHHAALCGEFFLTTLTCAQDDILRQAAAVQLNTYVRPTMKRHVWWKLLLGKSQKTFGMPLSASHYKDHTIYHDDLPAFNACFHENAMIPIFIKSCIMVILQSDMSVEGVFRKNGNIRQLKKTATIIDELPQVTVDHVSAILMGQNGVQLAALLKRYLRELPEPLFTYSLYPLFLECGRDRSLLHLACCLLPKPNRDTMIMLFYCLKWVSTFHEQNKMDIVNLARVIAPSVLYDKPSHAVDLQQGAQEEIHVIEMLIRDIDEIAQVPHDITLHEHKQKRLQEKITTLSLC